MARIRRSAWCSRKNRPSPGARDRQRRLPAGGRRHAASERATRTRGTSSTWSASTASSTATRPSSPAACASASRIARTLAFEPKILLMDEPFASLDEQTRLLLGDKVLQIQQELKQTTLLITHNITEAVQLVRPHPGDDLPARPAEAHRRHRPAAPAHLRDRRQRGVRPLRRADLERPARGGEPRHADDEGRARRAAAADERDGAALARAASRPGRARRRSSRCSR